MVKNPPCNAGDLGWILTCGSKIPHDAGQLSPCTGTTKLACPGAHEPQLEKLALCNEDPVSRNCVPMQLEKLALCSEDPVSRNCVPRQPNK